MIEEYTTKKISKERILSLKRIIKSLEDTPDRDKKHIFDMTLFLDVMSIKSNQTYRVWEKSVKIISPQQFPKGFIFSDEISGKIVALAYVEGFSIRFFEIDLTTSVGETIGTEKKKETGLISSDPSVIPIPKILGRPYIVKLAESSLRIDSIKKREEGWEVKVNLDGERFTFFKSNESSVWGIAN
ncbi:MAG: hypothetical protein JW786_13165 [Desulfobacterales bacterium]|nr:hypothetical protein [Desulfobacterales bacterium]